MKTSRKTDRAHRLFYKITTVKNLKFTPPNDEVVF